MELIGKRVLVTGASRGIGEATARRFAAVGATVALAARSADAIAALAAEFGGTAHPVDLAEPAQVDGFVARVEREAGGPVDVLVNNAGVELTGPFTATAPDDIQRLYQLNLVTPVQLCHQAIPRMTERGGGRIVNVSSAAASVATAGIVAYASSKAGLSSFARALDLELLGTPVKTVLVEIGFVPTEMVDQLEGYEPSRRARERLGRLRLSVDIPVVKVADAIVAAVIADRRRVRLPLRAAVWPAWMEVPQRAADLFLHGVPRRPTT
ncbi:MAG: SDR family oxidoreductase [Acidimicrobiales bacterium]|nr:SDR family oxidoreductase [Acidimicrobiales bacterium]